MNVHTSFHNVLAIGRRFLMLSVFLCFVLRDYVIICLYIYGVCNVILLLLLLLYTFCRSFDRHDILGPENVTTFSHMHLTVCRPAKDERRRNEGKKSQHNIKSIDFCSPLHLLSLSHSVLKPAAVRCVVIFGTCVIWFRLAC